MAFLGHRTESEGIKAVTGQELITGAVTTFGPPIVFEGVLEF